MAEATEQAVPGGARARRAGAFLITITAIGVALGGPRALAAQPGCDRARCEPAGPAVTPPARWSGELQVAGVNAVIGGLTAGLRSRARGDGFAHAFGRGAMGGVGVYAGKRLTTARFATAGLLGRQLAAVGASAVRNAGDDQGLFDRLVLPMWLGRVYVDRTGPARLRMRADLSAVLATAYAATRPELRVDLAASASSGIPVFLAADGYQGTDWDGRHAAGVVWLRESVVADDGGAMRSHVLAHEAIHAIQNDAAFVLWSLPAEERVRRRTLGKAGRYVDLGLQAPALGVVAPLAGYERRPWEREAHFLAGTR